MQDEPNEALNSKPQLTTSIIPTGQSRATSPDLTLNGGLYREKYQNGLKLGFEIILHYPVLTNAAVHFSWQTDFASPQFKLVSIRTQTKTTEADGFRV